MGGRVWEEGAMGVRVMSRGYVGGEGARSPPSSNRDFPRLTFVVRRGEVDREDDSNFVLRPVGPSRGDA